MPTGRLQWLAESIARHLANWASRGHRKAKCIPFEGLNEASIAVIVDRILTGMGYLTWPECRGYEEMNQEADLYAEAPDGSDRHLIEIKIVGEGGDARLNRKRFEEGRELLCDFDRLSKLVQVERKLVIWVASSPFERVESAGKDARTMRLGDVLEVVNRDFPGAKLEGAAHLGLEQYSECNAWKFVHIYCWVVK